MGSGLSIEVHDEKQGRVLRFEARVFPVRFGRESALNDVVLEYPFVSSYHARVDLVNGRLLVRDLGSRNGIRVGPSRQRVAVNEQWDLSPHGNTFSIGTLSIALHIAELSDEEPEGAELRSSITGKVVRAAHAREVDIFARGADANFVAGELDCEVDTYRSAWRNVIHALAERVGSRPSATSSAFLAAFARRHPDLVHEPEFQRLAEQHGLVVSREREQKRALDELQALSAFLLDKPLRSEADIHGFVRKLRQVLEAFLSSFIPLRDGLRTFERDVVQDNVRRIHPLETAKTVAEVATLLVDWSNAGDGGRALRSVFAEIMSHQVSMFAGVMDGVKALLEELSPVRIEAELPTEQRRSPRGGLDVWPFRFRSLWREFMTRHQDFASEETASFAVVFGPAFAAAYLHHFGAAARAAADVCPAAAAAPGGPTPRPAMDGGVARTPETHGMPKPKIGPTGTMVVPRVTKPLPSSGPMEARHPPAPAAPSSALSAPASKRR